MRKITKNLSVVCAVLGVGLMAGACTERAIELWEKPHDSVFSGHGDTHRQILAKHIVNPEPVSPTAQDSAVEGQRVTLGVDRYLRNEATISATSGGGSGGVSVKVPAK